MLHKYSIQRNYRSKGKGFEERKQFQIETSSHVLNLFIRARLNNNKEDIRNI